MAKTISSEQIIEINELYKECGTYAEVARRTGVSASTVRKYVNPNYVAMADLKVQRCDIGACREIIQSFTLSKEEMLKEDILNLSESEIADIHTLWEELSI